MPAEVAALSGVDGYNVYRGSTMNNVTTLVSPTGGITATSFTDTTAGNGTTYFYAVRAVRNRQLSDRAGDTRPAGLLDR